LYNLIIKQNHIKMNFSDIYIPHGVIHNWEYE
jgi:hypothetical protein